MTDTFLADLTERLGLEKTEEDRRDYQVRCVTIDPRSIDAEYTEVSAQLAYWGHRVAVARKNLGFIRIDIDEAEQRVKRMHAALYAEFQQSLSRVEKDSKGNEKIKKPTEPALEAAIMRDDRYHGAVDEVFDLRRERVEIEGLVSTLESKFNACHVKKDMLIQMGADRRKEIGSDNVLRRQAADLRSGENV